MYVNVPMAWVIFCNQFVNVDKASNAYINKNHILTVSSLKFDKYFYGMEADKYLEQLR